jgi:hypothetical protein
MRAPPSHPIRDRHYERAYYGKMRQAKRNNISGHRSCSARRRTGAVAELHEIRDDEHAAEFECATPYDHTARDDCLRAELTWFDRYLKGQRR